MVFGLSVTTKGTISDVDNLIERLKKELSRQTGEVALSLTREAKIEVPVKTGFLRRSIIPLRTDQFKWVVVVNASYGAFVHDGTRLQPPNPFLLRARLKVIQQLSGRNNLRLS